MLTRLFRILAPIAALAIAGVLVAGCGSSNSSSTTSGSSGATSGSTETSGSETSSSSAPAGKVKEIAIATPARETDYGWNQQGIAGARAAAKAVGAQLRVVSNIGYDKTQPVLRQLATSGADFIIAMASGFDTIADRIGQQYKVPTLTFDIPDMLTPGAVSNVTTSAEQGGYLAGILAAKTTKTGKVGVVISASDPNWFMMTGGFAQGVRSVDPKMPILFAQISSAGYDDTAGGKRVMSSMLSQGADVVFGMGDGSSFGYLQAVETANVGHKVWFISDIGDMTPIDKKGVVLSSVLWSFDKAFTQMAQQINDGTYGQKGYDLTLANGGISLLKTPHIKPAVWSQIEKAKQGIIDGSITVDKDTKIGAVKAALAPQ